MTKSKEPENKIYWQKSVVKFFVLIYCFSAPLWLIGFFIDNNNLPLNIPITDIVAAFTPLIAACILTYQAEGKKGVLKLLSKVLDFKKVDLIWWFVIFLVTILIFGLIYLLLVLNNYPIPNNWTISFLTIPLLFIFFFLGAIGEEVGYMGYAVDRLQQKFSAFWSSIIIGVPWILWHYPSMLQQGRNLNFIIWGTLGTIAFRTIYVWLYNNTNKSLFACILLHCLYNTARAVFPTDKEHNPLVDYPSIHYSVILFISLTVTLLWGQKTLCNFIGQKKTHPACH